MCKGFLSTSFISKFKSEDSSIYSSSLDRDSQRWINAQAVPSSNKSQSDSGKRFRDSVSPDKSAKRQKTTEKDEEEKEVKILRCNKCKKENIYNPKDHAFQYNLVMRIGWQCIFCKSCHFCGKADQEPKLIICDN